MSIEIKIDEAIMQVAKAKIAESMGGDVLGEIIQQVMDHKEKSSYKSQRDDRTLFEKIVQSHIEKAITTAVREHLEEDCEKIKKAVKASFEKGADEFATSVVDAFAKSDWRANLQIKILRDPD